MSLFRLLGNGSLLFFEQGCMQKKTVKRNKNRKTKEKMLFEVKVGALPSPTSWSLSFLKVTLRHPKEFDGVENY